MVNIGMKIMRKVKGRGKKYEKDAEEINVTRKWPGEGTGNQQMKVEQSISLILLTDSGFDGRPTVVL